MPGCFVGFVRGVRLQIAHYRHCWHRGTLFLKRPAADHTAHPVSSQFSRLAHHLRHPTQTISSSATMPSCASSRSSSHSMYLLCLIKISHKISYRTHFCLSRWNAVPLTYTSPASHVQHAHRHPAGLRQQCRSILHLHQGVPSPLLWLAMGRPGDARGASATLGVTPSGIWCYCGFILATTALMPPSMLPLYLLYACHMLYNACPILTAARHPIKI